MDGHGTSESVAETELMEFICNENNRDLEHLPDK